MVSHSDVTAMVPHTGRALQICSNLALSYLRVASGVEARAVQRKDVIVQLYLRQIVVTYLLSTRIGGSQPPSLTTLMRIPVIDEEERHVMCRPIVKL